MRIRGLLLIATTSILALAACGQQTPSNNAAQEVTPVDTAPVNLEGEADPPFSGGAYINLKYKFSVSMPEGWIQNLEASNEDGSIYENKAIDADARVSGSDNEGDVDFQQAIEAMREGTTDVEGAMIGENEYRGAATSEGDRVRVRLLKTPQGQLISLLVRYPVAKAADLDPVAIRTLDSLKLNP